MKKPLFTEIRREVIKENADIRVIYSTYLFVLLIIRRRPRFKIESSKIYYIFAIVPTIEVYAMPKGLWSDGNDGFAVSLRWLYWAVGVRIYKNKKR